MFFFLNYIWACSKFKMIQFILNKVEVSIICAVTSYLVIGNEIFPNDFDTFMLGYLGIVILEWI